MSSNRILSSLLWVAVAVVFVGVTVLVARHLGAPRELVVSEVGETDPARDINFARVQAHVEALSSVDTRISGYDGAEQAFQYIMDELESVGLGGNVEVQEFPVVVPVVDHASMTAVVDGGETVLELHPVWPNLSRTSQTPPQGIDGPIIDVGPGTDADLSGKRILDSIVVMDWDTRIEWLSVPEFGGKAVIFRGSDRGRRNTAVTKWLSVPADVPRFYVEEDDLPLLDAILASGSEVNVRCEMEWREVTARNILVLVNDTNLDSDDPDHDPVILTAYYDSISVVPTRSPGAEQSVSPAVLLELARLFKDRETTRPLFVVFTGGHGQNHAGMTRFVSELRQLRQRRWNVADAGPVISRMKNPGLITGLDLSSRSDQFGVNVLGQFPGQGAHLIIGKFTVLGMQLSSFARDFREDPDNVKRPQFLDIITPPLGRGWWTYFPYRAIFEHELPNVAGFPAVTLTTVNDERRYVDTPHDTVDRLDFAQLERQLGAERGARVGLANIVGALATWSGPFATSSLEDKWATLRGRVQWLDQDRNFTPNEPLAHATVFMKTGRDNKSYFATRAIPVALTDEDGRYTFDGLMDLTAGPTFQGMTLEAYGTGTRNFLAMNEPALEAYRIDVAGDGQDTSDVEIPDDGSIIFGVNMARPQDYPFQTTMDKAQVTLNLTVFPCQTATLLGLTDPRGFVALKEIEILEAGTKSPPFQFGQSATDAMWGNDTENLVTIWADPSLVMMANLGFSVGEKRLILINNTEETPEGHGFVLSELTAVPSMVLQGAMDQWRLNESRLQKLRAQGINNPRVETVHAEAREHLDRAATALANYDYLTYRIESEKGWALESRAYGEILGMINNMIRGVIFYLFLLIPFSYFLERLILNGKTVKGRIWGMVSIFMAAFIVLAVVHPAFRFTITPALVLLAFLMVSMAVIVSTLLLSKVDGYMKEARREAGGSHEDTQNVGNITIRAVDLGIANIRRRPQRGVLTAATIILVTFTLLSFTSLVPVISISRLNHPDGNPVYSGLLARQRDWTALPYPLFQSIERRFHNMQDYVDSDGRDGSVVSARAWFYSDHSGELSQIDLIPSTVTERVRQVGGDGGDDLVGGAFTAVALLSLSPQERLVLPVEETLLAGRWFEDPDEKSIIVSSHVARQLGYSEENIGDGIFLFGQELTLVGIYDERAFNQLNDMDGESLTPVNFVQQRTRMAQEEDTGQRDAAALVDYIHYPSDQIAIVPLKYGMALNAQIRSIAIRTGTNLDPEEEAEGYARRSSLTILASKGDSVTLYASLDSSQLKAAGEIGIPVLLGFLMVLGTMLGSVYERRREIFVYNSVGLSPTNVSSLFLAESFVYAVLGAGLGYLLGQVLSKVLLVTGALSGLTLNYSAGTTIFVTVLTMGIVLLSTLYPARQAFHAAIPDADRHDTSGDEGADEDDQRISLFLPFVASPGSIIGMMEYLHEYLHGIEGVSVGELAVDNLDVGIERQGDRDVPVLRFRAWLAPFDLGISHDTELRVRYREETGVFQFHLTAVHFSGEQQNWRRLTPRFLLTLRKQLLMWRIIPESEQATYLARGEETFGLSYGSGDDPPGPRPSGGGNAEREAIDG